MEVIKSKSGMSLPTMLAIVFLVISTLIGLITIARFQTSLVQKNIEFSEEYVNAARDIEAINYLINRDQITDELEINALASYLNLDVELVMGTVYRFSRDLNSVTKDVVGYMAPMTSSVSTYEELFIFTGMEDSFELSPLINATTMLAEFTKEYVESSFPEVVVDGDLSTFEAIIEYYESLTNDYYERKSPSRIENQSNPTVNNFWFITGDVELDDQDLTVADGYVLVIDGDLITDGDCNITGNIIVNGDFELNGGKRDDKSVVGTLYVNGDVKISRNTHIGTPSRPSFIIATGDVELANQITIYGYFIADDFSGQQGNNFITGGVYTNEEPEVNEKNLEPYTALNPEDLDSYAIATVLSVQSESGETSFTYTSPKLE